MKLYSNRIENTDIKENICLVYGSSEVWQEYAKQVFTSNQDYTHSKKINSTNIVDWSSLINEVSVTDLFAERKLIEVDLDSFTLNKSCTKYLEELTSLKQIANPVLLTSKKTNSSFSKHNWFNNLIKNHVAIQCFDLGDNEFKSWVKSAFRTAGYEADEVAYDTLSLHNYNNPIGIKASLKHLDNIKAKKKITASDIEKITFNDLNSNSFSLIGAALEANEKKCIAIVNEFKQSNTSEYLVLITIAREIRALHRFKLLNDNSKLTFTFNKLDKSRQEKLKGLSTHNLQKMLAQCALIEKVIKGLTSGDSWDMMLSLCLSLAGCQTMQGFIHPKEETII